MRREMGMRWEMRMKGKGRGIKRGKEGGEQIEGGRGNDNIM